MRLGETRCGFSVRTATAAAAAAAGEKGGGGGRGGRVKRFDTLYEASLELPSSGPQAGGAGSAWRHSPTVLWVLRDDQGYRVAMPEGYEQEQEGHAHKKPTNSVPNPEPDEEE